MLASISVIIQLLSISMGVRILTIMSVNYISNNITSFISLIINLCLLLIYKVLSTIDKDHVIEKRKWHTISPFPC